MDSKGKGTMIRKGHYIEKEGILVLIDEDEDDKQAQSTISSNIDVELSRLTAKQLS